MVLAASQYASPPETASALAHYSAPLDVAIPVIGMVIVVKAAAAWSKRRSAFGGEITVRCGEGHVFQTTWSPWASFLTIRLGPARFQRCPVARHRSLVRPVDRA